MGELKDWQAEEIKELEAKVERLREDRERLEWCARNQAEFYRDDPYWIIRWIDLLGDWCAEAESTMAKDWRDAIDAAMKKSSETAGGWGIERRLIAMEMDYEREEHTDQREPLQQAEDSTD